jgi:hypothetical protein
LSLAAGYFLLTPALGQAPREREYLDQVKRATEIAAQKTEVEIRTAVTEAAKLSTTNPAGAIERLQEALAVLAKDTALTNTRRDALRRMLQERIRSLEPDAARAGQKTDKKLVIVGDKAKKRQTAEEEDINRTLSTIRSLQKEGKNAEAAKLAAELARRYPSNPAAQAGNTAASIASQVIGDRKDALDRDKRIVGTFRDVDKSAQPPSGDIEFDKDFQKRTAGRSSGIPLTAKEKAVLKALATPLPAIDFNSSKFEDVMKYLADVTDQPLVIDPQALREAQIDYTTPITFKAPKGVTVRTVLRRVLGEFGMTYIVKDETIQIVSIAKARETLTTRTYYLGDLVDGGIGLGARVALWWPGIQEAQMAANAKAIMDVIKTVDPESWKDNGGQGTIAFFPLTRTLVIRQTAEVHGILSGSFR